MGQSCPPGACGLQTHTGRASGFGAPRFMSQPPKGSRACSWGQCFSDRTLGGPVLLCVGPQGPGEGKACARTCSAHRGLGQGSHFSRVSRGREGTEAALPPGWAPRLASRVSGKGWGSPKSSGERSKGDCPWVGSHPSSCPTPTPTPLYPGPSLRGLPSVPDDWLRVFPSTG